MNVCKALCQAILLIFSIVSLQGCTVFGTQESNFQWLDVDAVPVANTDVVFEPNATFGELASAYINLKHECRATNNGVEELRKASDELRKLR